jgi:hypothetical protein
MNGLCECGCGEPTSLARQNEAARGRVKGEPLRFKRGHWARVHKPCLGRTGSAHPMFGRPPETHYRWKGDEASYQNVHERLKAERGSASEYVCVECEKTAAHWALDHGRATDVQSSKRGQFSLNLYDYDPRCVSCHKRMDLARLGRARE